jgi:hypothetical protein
MDVKLVSHTTGEHGLKVSEDRVLRKIFGPKREKVAGGYKRLHNEELHNLYTSPNIIRVIESRDEMGRPCSMHGRNLKYVQNFGRKPQRREHSEDLGVDGRILKWILGKQSEKVWTGFSWLRIRTSGRILCTR